MLKCKIKNYWFRWNVILIITLVLIGELVLINVQGMAENSATKLNIKGIKPTAKSLTVKVGKDNKNKVSDLLRSLFANSEQVDFQICSSRVEWDSDGLSQIRAMGFNLIKSIKVVNKCTGKIDLSGFKTAYFKWSNMTIYINLNSKASEKSIYIKSKYGIYLAEASKKSVDKILNFINWNNTSEKDAVQLIKEYKTQLYDIPDYNVYLSKINNTDQLVEYINDINSKFKQYFTDKEYKSFVAGRMPIIYRDAAKNSKLNMRLYSITLNKTNVDVKKQEIVFDYIAKIELNINSEISYLKENGQITIQKQNNQWLISSDWTPHSPELMKLIYPKL